MSSSMSAVKGLKTVLNASGRYRYRDPDGVVDYLVVGGGVVGLAIAQRLSQKHIDKSVYLVERHSRAGEETSSRNSEVVHSGLYYPESSLKTRLCLRGRQMLYDRCKSHSIPYTKTGKLVVALEGQQSYIEKLHDKAQTLKWPPRSPSSFLEKRVLPTELISGDEARALESKLSKEVVAALWSPETGIVDSHTLMESLEKDIIDSDAGELVYSTRIVRIDASHDRKGWIVQTLTGSPENKEQQTDALLVRTLINAGGLSAPTILNSILPADKRVTSYFARGSYASYNGKEVSGIERLIYPCPDATSHAFQSLGTHLTMDLQGKVRFGPDLEWLSPPRNDDEDPDFWAQYLIPDETRLPEMHRAVTQYLPDVKLDGMAADYVGVRPKIGPPNSGFHDFTFRADYPGNEVGGGMMVSLLGIESPGLTSSLAIAEMVVEELLE